MKSLCTVINSFVLRRAENTGRLRKRREGRETSVTSGSRGRGDCEPPAARTSRDTRHVGDPPDQAGQPVGPPQLRHHSPLTRQTSADQPRPLLHLKVSAPKPRGLGALSPVPAVPPVQRAQGLLRVRSEAAGFQPSCRLPGGRIRRTLGSGACTAGPSVHNICKASQHTPT